MKLTEVLLDLDLDTDRLWGLHTLADVLSHIIHVLLEELIVLPRRIRFLLT